MKKTQQVEPEDLLSHRNFILSLALNLVFDEHLAEDIAQETLLAAFESPPAPTRSLRAWFAVVARNIAYSLQRRESKRLKREQAAARSESISSTDEKIERENLRRRLANATLKLREPYRSAVLFRFYEGLTPRRIALQLGIPVGTVKSHIHRGIQQLRKELDLEYCGDRKRWRLALAPLAGLPLATSSASAGTSIGAIGLGVIAVSAKLKIAIAAGLLFVCAFAVWQLFIKNSRQGFEPEPKKKSPLVEEFTVAGKKGPALQEGPKQDIETSLQLTGQVLARNNGEAVENAFVIVNVLPLKSNAKEWRGKTNSSGKFRIPVQAQDELEITSYHIHIEREGFVPLDTCLPHFGINDVRDCGPFFLEENKKFSIRIIDEARNSIAGAKLEVIHHIWKYVILTRHADSEGLIQFTEGDIVVAMSNKLVLCYLRISAKGMSDVLLTVNFDK